MCGLPHKFQRGTRDAAQNWNASYTKLMADEGFATGKASPWALWLKDREIRVLMHGDDVACLGWRQQLDWCREENKKRFGVKYRGGTIPGDKEGKEMRILNRIESWTGE